MTPAERSVEVAVVGGGPAGAAAAIHLAAAGVETVVFERLRAPRWRASGVYSSPGTRRKLGDLGLSSASLSALIRPIDAMEVIGPRGTVCRLSYDPPDEACGVDRIRLERAMLDRAAQAGAGVREGAVVRAVSTEAARSRGVGGTGDRAAPSSTLEVSTVDGPERWRARVVVGADGPGSMVARSYGVDRPGRSRRRAGLTVHRHDPEAAPAGVAMTARMIIGDDWYCGVAPVPAGRVNIGIVMSERQLRQDLQRTADPASIVATMVGALPGPRAAWQDAPDTDDVMVAVPLAHRVMHRHGPGFLLVGDACGFIDPVSGEGLHRALVSAELAADAVTSLRRGDGDALERYERRMRARSAPRDLVSWLLQAFLGRPDALEYALRRLARRERLRATFARALADLEPASAILEPRFLLSLLAP